MVEVMVVVAVLRVKMTNLKYVSRIKKDGKKKVPGAQRCIVSSSPCFRHHHPLRRIFRRSKIIYTIKS